MGAELVLGDVSSGAWSNRRIRQASLTGHLRGVVSFGRPLHGSGYTAVRPVIVRPSFVFLREDGESNSAAVARCALQATSPGPMSRSVRAEDYKSFLEAGFAVDTTTAPVFNSGGTHCAIFVRCCFACAGVKPRGRRPTITGITSWLGVGWFVKPEWIPVEDLVDGVFEGDVPYWCGYPWMSLEQWRLAKDGHVGVILPGEEGSLPRGGWVHKTAEGGGGNDGSLCRMSEKPKDIRWSGHRPLRGVWRPNNMGVRA